MFCSKCHNDLVDCTCSDLDERLAALAEPNSGFVYRMCLVCGRHYSRCNCKYPEWVLSNSDAAQKIKESR